MKKSTHIVLTILHVICWIIFIGCCIQTGTLLYCFLASFFINPAAASNLYNGLDLSALKAADPVYYGIMASCLVILCALRALLFYFVIKVFLKINFIHPFSEAIGSWIRNMASVALLIGLLAAVMTNQVDKLKNDGIALSDLPNYLQWGVEYLLFAGLLFAISLVFKKGIELQSENELTI